MAEVDDDDYEDEEEEEEKEAGGEGDGQLRRVWAIREHVQGPVVFQFASFSRNHGKHRANRHRHLKDLRRMLSPLDLSISTPAVLILEALEARLLLKLEHEGRVFEISWGRFLELVRVSLVSSNRKDDQMRDRKMTQGPKIDCPKVQGVVDGWQERVANVKDEAERTKPPFCWMLFIVVGRQLVPVNFKLWS
ncbi:hypothetical protein BDZ97DRAFT_1765686 [Flammula alnicola]|nr:hypothetical protein BDZ97DRAFT_1765686 [Flammula alnicola]